MADELEARVVVLVVVVECVPELAPVLMGF
jgi:hypothetical protein